MFRAQLRCPHSAMEYPFCGFRVGIAVGALVGYDFGPLAVQVWFDQTVECANAVCGLDVWGRFSFKIWGPETPKPVTSKN
jgi:hypothetical protein